MKKTNILLALVLVWPLLLSAKTTTLYHTSDVHGFFYPRNGQGGYAALAAVMEKGPQNYLLLDSGDFANGTAETRYSKGAKAATIMNKMGYDATTVGNHEFDFKNAGFAPLIAKLNFPVLAANMFEKGSMKYPPHIQPYQVYEVDGIKVGVIGLANRHPTNPATNYYFNKPFDALENALTEVEKQNPNFVVVLVHDSIADDKHGEKPYTLEIADKFAGRVHMVLGGHAHKIVQNRIEKGVLFVESGCHLENVSKVTVVTDDKTGKFVSAKSELIPLKVEQTGEDEEIKKFLDSLREPGIDEVIGETQGELKKNPTADDRLDSPLNDWVADLMKDYSGAPIAIHNNGGARTSLPKGKITRRDLVELHPFDNDIVNVTVDGRFLKKFIRTGFAPRSLFTYSGLEITYKTDKKGRIKNIKIFYNGKPLENNKKYIVATNSHIAYGGSEGYLFKKIDDSQKHKVGTKTIRTLAEEAVRSGKTQAPKTGRIHKI